MPLNGKQHDDNMILSYFSEQFLTLKTNGETETEPKPHFNFDKTETAVFQRTEPKPYRDTNY